MNFFWLVCEHNANWEHTNAHTQFIFYNVINKICYIHFSLALPTACWGKNQRKVFWLFLKLYTFLMDEWTEHIYIVKFIVDFANTNLLIRDTFINICLIMTDVLVHLCMNCKWRTKHAFFTKVWRSIKRIIRNSPSYYYCILYRIKRAKFIWN